MAVLINRAWMWACKIRHTWRCSSSWTSSLESWMPSSSSVEWIKLSRLVRLATACPSVRFSRTAKRTQSPFAELEFFASSAVACAECAKYTVCHFGKMASSRAAVEVAKHLLNTVEDPQSRTLLQVIKATHYRLLQQILIRSNKIKAKKNGFWSASSVRLRSTH